MLRKAVFKPLYDSIHEQGAGLPSAELRALRSVQVISFVHDRRGAFLRWFTASFATLVLTFALLVVVGGVPRVGHPSAPPLSLGASLQAVGYKAQAGALTVPAVSDPLPAPDRKDRAARAAQPGWTAAALASERSVNLRLAANPGQPSQRGRYELRTVLSGLKRILTMTPSTAWVMALIALLAFLMGRSMAPQPIASQAGGSSEPTPAHKTAALTIRVSRSLLPRQRARRAPQRAVFPRLSPINDLLADWERVRLVPT